MAGKIQYAVSVTPIATVPVGTDYAEHEVIEKSVGGTIGGSDTLAIANNINVTGYGSGALGNPDYGNCPASGQLSLGGNAAQDLIFIKHTGHQYSSATTLGAESTATNKLKIIVEADDASANEGGQHITIAKLLPGGAIVLPEPDALAADCTWKVESSTSESIAVEYGIMKTS